MLPRDDPRFLSFRDVAEQKLLRVIHDLQSQGWDTDAALDRAEEIVLSSLGSNTLSLDRIPPFDERGWLPAAHQCDFGEFEARFAGASQRRRELLDEFRRIYQLALSCDAVRLIVGGSFITDVEEPGDVDAALLVPPEFFSSSLRTGETIAGELWRRSQQSRSVQLFIERDESAWWGWYRLFQGARDPVTLYRGVLEIRL